MLSRSWNPPHFISRGGGGLNFQSFRKKGGSDFSHKKGEIGKIGGSGYLKKGWGYHLFSY